MLELGLGPLQIIELICHFMLNKLRAAVLPTNKKDLTYMLILGFSYLCTRFHHNWSSWLRMRQLFILFILYKVLSFYLTLSNTCVMWYSVSARLERSRSERKRKKYIILTKDNIDWRIYTSMLVVWFWHFIWQWQDFVSQLSTCQSSAVCVW